jgi:hypothetical protein
VLVVGSVDRTGRRRHGVEPGRQRIDLLVRGVVVEAEQDGVADRHGAKTGTYGRYCRPW